MRKLCWLLVLMMCFAGCADDEPVFETICDDIIEPVAAEPAPVSVWIPDGAAAQTMVDETAGECYTWEDSELRVQTLTGGDIRATLQQLTGLAPEKLTVMEYRRGEVQMYQTVWCMTEEAGITMGRCLVADDGNFHYCISLLSPEDADVEGDFAQICASLDLTGEDAVK